MALYRNNHSSGNFYAVLVAALAVILFFAIVFWPSGSNSPTGSINFSETPLSISLNDPETERYLTTLSRVKPRVAKRLNQKAEQALANGASQNELASIVLTTYSEGFEKDMKHLLRADVRYLEEILSITKNGLMSVSRQTPDLCRVSQYKRFENMRPREIAKEMSAYFSYGTRGYSWALKLNSAMLEAVEDGRRAPKKHGRLTSSDKSAIHEVTMKLLERPQMQKLISLQNKSKTEQRRALANMNMCSLTAELLSTVDKLPSDTKARLVGELHEKSKSGDFDRLVRVVRSAV